MYAEAKALGLEFHRWHVYVRQVYLDASDETQQLLVTVRDGVSLVGRKGRGGSIDANPFAATQGFLIS